MQVPHHGFGPLVQHMGVDLGGGHIRMAQKLLHHAQVSAILQQVAGEGMPQHMRADLVGRKPGSGSDSLEIARKHLAGQVAGLALRRKQEFRGCQPGMGRHQGPIARHGRNRRRAQHHHPVLVALAAHDQGFLARADCGGRQGHQLAHAQARGIEQLQQGRQPGCGQPFPHGPRLVINAFPRHGQ